MRVLVRNGTVVSPDGTRAADVLIEGERIARVAPGIAAEADAVYDAAGRCVLPGGIDVHTHLDMPYGPFVTADDFASGTIAAACGGTTAIIDFAVQERGRSLHSALETWQRRADGQAVIDYGFHLIVCDLGSSQEAELDALVAEGVPTFKLFMAYPDRLMLDDAAILRALRRTAANGGMVLLHAEDGAAIERLRAEAVASGDLHPHQHPRTRPNRTESSAAQRAVALARRAGAPVYIVHVSAAETVGVIAEARAHGLAVHGETCPQYLTLTDERYEGDPLEAAKYVMSPPLRKQRDCERLWDALAAGELEVVATDHCPFRLADQKGPAAHDFTRIPGGAPGIETRMPLLFDGGVAGGRFGIERFVEMTATAPAKLHGLYPRKGILAPGSDADLVVWDPQAVTTISAARHHMRVDHSIYEGRTVRGTAELVIARGRVLVERSTYVGPASGGGRFLRRSAGTG